MESQVSQPKLFSGTSSFSPEINSWVVVDDINTPVDIAKTTPPLGELFTHIESHLQDRSVVH